MSQPTSYPDWATNNTVDEVSGQENKIQPSAQLQTNGYFTGDIPAANNLNWLWNNTGQWIRYLSGVVGNSVQFYIKSSNGAASAMLPAASSTYIAYVANEAGEYALAIGYQVNTATLPTLSAFGGGTMAITVAVGGIVSASSTTNPTSPMTLIVISAGA